MLIGPIYLFYFSISPDTNPSRKDLKLSHLNPGEKFHLSSCCNKILFQSPPLLLGWIRSKAKKGDLGKYTSMYRCSVPTQGEVRVARLHAQYILQNSCLVFQHKNIRIHMSIGIQCLWFYNWHSDADEFYYHWCFCWYLWIGSRSNLHSWKYPNVCMGLFFLFLWNHFGLICCRQI